MNIDEVREKIAYIIYMVDRSEKAAMPIEEFIAYKGNTYIMDCKIAADKILSTEIGGEVVISKCEACGGKGYWNESLNLGCGMGFAPIGDEHDCQYCQGTGGKITRPRTLRDVIGGL
jgi:hypothetical protein